MKIKKSILELHKFWVVRSQFLVNPPSENQQTPENIELDIDFEILVGEDLFKIVLQLEGNKGKKRKVGYSFKIEVEGIFGFSEKMSEEDSQHILLYSAIPMMIANTRGYLANITSYSFFGQYLLPSVDINNLIEKKVKAEQIKQNQEK